jgi:hypothetical protein
MRRAKGERGRVANSCKWTRALRQFHPTSGLLATVSSLRETRRTVSASSMDGLKNSSVIAKSCSAYQVLPRNTTSSRGGTPVSQVGRHNYPIEVTLIGGNAAAMHHNETLARRIVAEVDHVTAGRPMRWVTLQQVARRLKVHHSSAAAAVRVAVDGGWLVAEGSPPHSICRTEIGRTLPQPDSPYAKEHSTEAPK